MQARPYLVNEESAAVPFWKVQTSLVTGDDASELSAPSLDTSSWYTIGSKATLMSTLLENNIYSESEIFYSINLQNVDYSQFRVPWYYRAVFELGPSNGSHYQLKTNGISSRADLWLNGEIIADKDFQAGAYVGLTYDISKSAKEGENILLVRAYPTDYNRDLALGFVDWNPYPPDNGTGIWRDVEIKKTGQVSVSPPRVTTTLEGRVSIKVDVANQGDEDVQGEVVCTVVDPSGKELGSLRSELMMASKLQQKVTLGSDVQDPQIWWPKQWGPQPLYSTSCTVYTSSGVSDRTQKTRFGIRTVTSELNSYNDTTFFVNGEPFQVVGAGYTSDMFLRFDEAKLRAQFEYVLDMGLNTVRLEGKQEHPYLYDLADELGLMVMAGWECCNKWEGWSYNDEGSGITWSDPDYAIANNSMRHEAEMMQPHPSMLTFLIGSDFWPDDRATKMYVDALRAFDWDTPIIASASQRGYPSLLGNGGMKMLGPYDWVAPSYWYDPSKRLGSAFGFGSELGAGVGTPELSSLRKFLSPEDQDDLWRNPDKGLYHMSTNVSSFYTRTIYNDALWARYGAPTSLQDYVLKAQMADYEATRAEYEAYAANWNAERPATGLIYWMLNNAWPSLHWNLFDFYLHPGGSYFGTKVGTRKEHVVFDYASKIVYLINRSLDIKGDREVEIEVLGLDGESISKKTVTGSTEPNASTKLSETVELPKDVLTFLLRLTLKEGEAVVSQNTYWLSSKEDVLDWDASTWYHTPATSYADFTALNDMNKADVEVTSSGSNVVLENKSKVPAVFVRLNLVDGQGEDVLPVVWEDNYVTLWPGERLELGVNYESGQSEVQVQVDGKNVDAKSVPVGGGY
ncbi:glycoside hydrolase [Corynespora cassiicola Philippines]|uniref:Glycoside hydrolase n=1 Tax=Corynespora cassiicola Philippines TaxID=1448308 RepID=A0A2T2PAR9_CORCC|nr:glycoside hydrolase [Corynespora cassiicola Philippines]